MYGGGGGSIQAMIVSLRNNKYLVRRKSYFKLEDSIALSRDTHKMALTFRKPTPEILMFIQRKHAKRKKIFGALASLVVLLTGAATISILWLAQPNVIRNKRVAHAKIVLAQKQEEVLNQKRYITFISEGDYWLSQSHFKNAAFQYDAALFYFPKSEVAKTRLELSYALACERQNLFCEALEALQK